MLVFKAILLVIIQVTVSLPQPADDYKPRTNIDNSITFNLPLTATWETEDGRTHELTAFRHKRNDEIMNEMKVGNFKRVPELQWVSPGRPVFVRTKTSRTPFQNSTDDIRNFFHFTTSALYTEIQMLTEEQKVVIAQQASRETHVNISTQQLGNLPLKKFECLLTFHDELANKDRFLKGTVGDFITYPLRMDFEAPTGTMERERLQHTKPKDLKFNCRFSLQAQVIRVNKLSITGQQLQDNRIADKLFGDSKGGGTNEIYVTRGQLFELASEMYATLNIMKDYEMPESAFSDAFVDEIVRQLATRQFTMVPIETVLAAISSYSLDFSGDLTADRIFSDLGKILRIEQVNNISRIVSSKSKATSNEREISANGGGLTDASGSIVEVGMAALKRVFEFAFKFFKANSESTGSLDDQLKELNRLSRDEAEWKIEGNRVIPKSLNVAKISQTRLGGNITFNGIRRHFSDADLDYPLKMYMSTDQTISPGNYRKMQLKRKRIGYELIGCFNQNQSSDLQHYKLFNYEDMTLQKCAESCGTSGFEFAGVHSGYFCGCNESFTRYDKVDQCDIPCNGCKTEKCGGQRAVSVLLIKLDGDGTTTCDQDLNNNGNVNQDGWPVDDQQLLNDIVPKMNQLQEAYNKIKEQLEGNGQRNFGPPGWVLVQQHYNGSTFFHRGWQEYKQGFGNTRGDYWIGNDRLHALTSSPSPYKLRFDLQAKNNSQWYWAEYDAFTVYNERTNYRMFVSVYSGTAGDRFGDHNGREFQTLDHNNADGCASGNVGLSGGFWYNHCGFAAINASPLLFSSSGTRGFIWGGLPPGERLMTSRMWLVPKNS